MMGMARRLNKSSLLDVLLGHLASGDRLLLVLRVVPADNWKIDFDWVF